MRSGDHDAAWALNERIARQRAPESRDDPAVPYHLRWVWDMRELAGCDVLVRCYHGLGDTLQFLRFMPELRRRAASVTLEIQPRLMALVDDSFADRVAAFDVARPLPPAERDVEIMELSFALRARPADFPPPYIALPSVSPGSAVIGLCCVAGNWDESRSVPPALLAPLCEGRDCLTLDPQPSPLPVRNPAGCPFDLAETARLIARTSLVITVDTMIAHLAGAMNKPAWLLLKHEPDWRWAPASGGSEWYPSLRLYAQPSPGDWASVAQRVGRDLERFIPQRSMQHG